MRRLATLVGRGVEPPKVFEAVASEMRRCVRGEIACLWRYETAGEITLIAASHHSGSLVKWPVGTRTPFAGDTLGTVLQRTGRPARMDSYDNAAGALAARIRAAGIREAVGVPIIVDGRNAWRSRYAASDCTTFGIRVRRYCSRWVSRRQRCSALCVIAR